MKKKIEEILDNCLDWETNSEGEVSEYISSETADKLLSLFNQELEKREKKLIGTEKVFDCKVCGKVKPLAEGHRWSLALIKHLKDS